MKRARSIAARVLLFPLVCFSWLMAVALLLCYIAMYVSPSIFWPLAYFGLTFQVFFLLNAGLLFVWILARKRVLLVHLVALLPSVFFVDCFVKVCSNEAQPDPRSRTIKVMSYNVQMFQLPFKKKDFSFQAIADFLNREQPDVVCLQEFYTAKGKLAEEQFAALLRGLDYRYVFYNVRKDDTGYGIATFSRFPIKMRVEIDFEGTANAALYTDIDIGGSIVRVYNVHLQSVRLNVKKSLRRILGNQDEKRLDELGDVSTRLRTAFVKRAQQVDDLSQRIKVSPYPVIVCGDFNDTPMSYTYRKVKGAMKDTFREAGEGMPSTYEGFFPSFRIDYIFHHPDMTALSYNVAKTLGLSDHHPVVSTIALSPGKYKE